MQKIKDVYPGTLIAAKMGEATFIPPVMGPSLRLAVGEAAGAEEDAIGKPLVGGAGRIMDSLWRKAGIQRDQISIINTIPCKPPNNYYPTDTSARSYCTLDEGTRIVEFCYEQYVKPVLQSRPWTRIDAIGEKSLRLLTGKTEGIMKWRGSPLPLSGGDKPLVIGILHPAYLMRDSAMIPATISDLMKGVQVPPQFYNTHPTLGEVQEFNANKLCFDIETNRYSNQITMVGISDITKPYHILVVPFQGLYIAELRRIFATALEVVGQNIIQFDLPHLADAGIVIHPETLLWDIMLMHHLVQPDAPHDLEYIASICTQMQAWKHLKSKDEPWYCAGDVDATAQSFLALKARMDQQGLTKLYNLVQVPLARICKLMSDTGIKVDGNQIKTQRIKYLAELKVLEDQLPEQLRPYDKPTKKRVKAPVGTLGKSGKPIKFVHVPSTERVVPWQSPKVIEKYIYETLHLPEQFHAKTKKLTTDKTALDRLYRQSKNPFLKQLREIRSLDEIIGTFLKDGDEDKQVAVGRVHSNFLVHGTSTGRLSSSGPNMQNVPPIARYIYVPSHSDWCFVECVAPETKILDSDLNWRRADSFQIGQPLIGFTENGRRKICESRVTNIRRIIKHCYRLTTDKGTIMVAQDHSFVVFKTKTNLAWCQTKNIEVGDEIAYFVRPWEADKSYEGGWLAGILDGEGYTSSCKAAFGQNEGIVLDRALDLLRGRGYACSINDKAKCKKVVINGEAFAGLRAIGEFRPVRLLQKAKQAIYGKQVWGKKTERAKVIKKEYLNLQEVIAIETTSHTYIAEGMLSHNCDFSSLENRLASWYAEDTDRLLRLSVPGFNEHRWLASQIFNIPESQINKKSDEYDRAKHTNHGADAGMGPRKMSIQYNVPEKDCKELLLMWKKLNWKSAQWQERIGNQAIKEGVLTTAFGRKRWFWNQTAYTEGIRFILQSSGADVCYRSMIALMYERIGWPIEKALQVCPKVAPLPHPARLVLQVHDSLLVETPLDKRDEVVEAMRTCMVQPWPELAGYEIPVAFKIGEPGESWGSLKE